MNLALDPPVVVNDRQYFNVIVTEHSRDHSDVPLVDAAAYRFQLANGQGWSEAHRNDYQPPDEVRREALRQYVLDLDERADNAVAKAVAVRAVVEEFLGEEVAG